MTDSAGKGYAGAGSFESASQANSTPSNSTACSVCVKIEQVIGFEH
jgi:hypothetical protein